jgi:asparagine synthase (glutamine-hydrolysing)
VVTEDGRPRPSIAQEGTVTVVLDGSLVDRSELEAALAADPVPTDDAALIGAAYARLGVELLSHISGAFALVLWDASTGRLLCARDRVGIHPLLYSASPTAVAVGSFLEPILRRPEVPKDVDRIAVAARILETPLQPDETPFAAVRRVPPGHALEVSESGFRVFRYWDPGEPGSEVGMSMSDAVERFESLLAAAVGRSLAAGPLALFLSGGIDSALVAAVATRSSVARQLPHPVALALMIDAPDVDEAANQRAVAADLDLELVHTSLDGVAGTAGLLRGTLAVSASGSAGPADIIQPIYDHLARQGLERGRSTVLNGQGGDEWLLPPALYAADRLRALDLPAVWRLWHAWYHHYPRQSTLATTRSYLWGSGARPFVRETALRLERSISGLRSRRARTVLDRIPRWLAPDAALRSDLVERMLAATEPSGGSRELLRTARRRLLDRPDRPGITEEAFAMRRRIGVRLDTPLLDAAVVEFLHRLPPDLLVRDGRAKALARAVVADRLPSFGGRWPRTVSGDRFFHRLIERESMPAWRSAGGTPFLAQVGIVDDAELRRRVEDGESPAWLWPATNLDVWLRACVGTSPPIAEPR